MLTLSILDESNNDNVIKFSKFPVSIGRLPENDLILSDLNISRIHAIVEKKENNFLISDVNSTNGTYLNKVKIIDTEQLKHNDLIILGKTFIKVYLN
tara:strand:+ start:2373 stop:2663 length:291 start_codon:yes stop_codon:yes gene_type:complete